MRRTANRSAFFAGFGFEATAISSYTNNPAVVVALRSATSCRDTHKSILPGSVATFEFSYRLCKACGWTNKAIGDTPFTRVGYGYLRLVVGERITRLAGGHDCELQYNIYVLLQSAR